MAKTPKDVAVTQATKAYREYKVRATCTVCAAVTLESISVSQPPKINDKIPFACKRLITADNACCGDLIVRSIFSKGVAK